MKRVKGTDGVKLIECVNPMLNKWHVRWDVQPAAGTNANGELETGVSYMEAEFLHEPSLEEIKVVVCAGIDEYDSSTEVNAFTVNGMPLWLDKQTRTSLSYTISVEEQARSISEGEVPTTQLWYNGLPPVSFDIPTEQLKQMLAALELYAKATYDVTQSHKAAVYSFETADAVLSFDIRADYPEKLAFSL